MTRLHRLPLCWAWHRGHPKWHGGPGVPGLPWMMGTGELRGTSLEKSSVAGRVCTCLFGQFVAGEQQGRRARRLRPSDHTHVAAHVLPRLPAWPSESRPKGAPSLPWKWTCQHEGATPFLRQRPPGGLCVTPGTSCTRPLPAAAPLTAAPGLVLMCGPHHLVTWLLDNRPPRAPSLHVWS